MPDQDTNIALIKQDIEYIKRKLDEALSEIKPVCEWKTIHETEHKTFTKVMGGLWAIGVFIASIFTWGVNLVLGK